MKKLLRRLIVIAGVTGMVMALNMGVAWAHHGDANPNSPFAEAEAIADAGVDDGLPPPHVDAALTTPGSAPVGTALGCPNPGTHPGCVNMSPQVVIAITHNPNCPRHYLP